MTINLFAKIGAFFSDLRQSLVEGVLFFGGPIDTIVAILDILVTAFLIYHLLRLFHDSRAWQLMKGVLLIIALTIIANIVGLNAIGFLLNGSLSLLAIAVIVLFQPELRRTLETVGRSRFGRLTGTLVGNVGRGGHAFSRQLVESIVSACDSMKNTRTGALIIIERDSKLGDLIAQENAVPLDAAVTTALLRQIFYVGSPLHDGAVVIRDGRVAAARVHIPLSDNYHLRREFGTRHRAAVGASEIGDTVAVVVSEERGAISIAIEGRLYVLSDADALRTQLHRLLLSDRARPVGGPLSRLFRRRTHDDAFTLPGETPIRRRLFRRGVTTRDQGPRRQRVALYVLSLLIASGLWVYVQMTVNPIDTKTFIVPLTYRGTEAAAARGLSMLTVPIETVNLTLTGRRQVLSALKAEAITAYVDVNRVDKPGLQSLPVEIATDTLMYTQTKTMTPAEVQIDVYVSAKER